MNDPKARTYAQQNTRRQWTLESLTKAQNEVLNKMSARLNEKGYGVYASPHEAAGIIAEEWDELREALQINDWGEFHSELIDIAVACILALASETGEWDWLREEP